MRQMSLPFSFYSPKISLFLLNGNGHIHQFICYNRAKDMVSNCSERQDTRRGPVNQSYKWVNSRFPS